MATFDSGDLSDIDSINSIAYSAGADLSTVSPNPTVSSYGGSGSTDGLSALANTAGQWGATIASIVAGQPAVVTSSGARVGAMAVAPVSSTLGGSTGLILLVLGAVVLFVILGGKS